MQQPQQPGNPMWDVKYPEPIAKQIKDGLERRDALGWAPASYEQGLQVMFLLFGGWPAWRKLNEPAEDLSAPASPVEEKREQFKEWAKDLAEMYAHQIQYSERGPEDSDFDLFDDRSTSFRAGADAAYQKLTESKPSPVIEIGEQRGWDSLKIIGRVQDRFNELIDKGWDWPSFYNGWLEGRSDMLITVNAEIGTLDEGQHPDEIYPRAITWLQERKNGIDEVERLRNHIAKLEGTTTEQSTICGCGRILIPRLDVSGKKIGVTHETIEDEEHHSEYFRSLTVKPEASHPALIVGERDKTEEDRVKSGNKLLDMIDELLTPPALTEQALPEEINVWIESEIKSQGINVEMFHGIGAKKVAIAMYRKMQEEMGQVIENAVAFSRLSVKQANELVELKETLRIAQQNESSYRAWLEESREEADTYRKAFDTARTLILNIKRGNIYQEPADECDKWLHNNPETK